MDATRSRTKWRYSRLIAINAVILGLILVVSEGLASYVLLARDIVRQPTVERPITDRLHTEYHPDLGWAHKPNVEILDLYGPGAYMRTNGQGFRSNYEFDPAVSKGRIRIICSGDSMTLGYGVGNDHTWCQRLTTRDPRLETLNMGQSGYGVDQAYLWYKREGSMFEHHIHLMAFIINDVHRMQSGTFLGHGKPVLTVVNNKLVVTNVPVPKRTVRRLWLTQLATKFRRLRTMELIDSAMWKFGLRRAGETGTAQTASIQKSRRVLRKVFEDLQLLNEERSSQLVLVLLPTLYDLTQSQRGREWTEFLEAESTILGIPMIDLLEEFGKLKHKDIADMFFEHGHFTERGNEFAARLIYQELKDHPVTTRILSTGERN